MHRSIETCLALANALHICGFNLSTDIAFVQDVASSIVGIKLSAQGKPDYLIPAGEMSGTPAEREAAWRDAVTTWNKPKTAADGLSEVERRVMREMNLKKVHVTLVLQLVQRGYDLPGLPENALTELREKLQAAQG